MALRGLSVTSARGGCKPYTRVRMADFLGAHGGDFGRWLARDQSQRFGGNVMNVLDAAYNTVHDYPGGAVELAGRLGKRSGSTLSHEVCPPEGSSAKFGLLDAVKVMEMTKDHRIMHAMATRLGGMFVPLSGLDMESPDTVHLAQVAREFAEVMAEVAPAMADGVITDNELARIEREWGELQRVGGQMLAHFARLNGDSKPVTLRAVGA
jgi:hypothetical protein